jgi:hypothetical protein
MDLKVYYQKLRETESGIAEAHAVVVSLGTPDGGRAGVVTEVPRAIAARLIVESSARQATAEEAQAFREDCAEKQHLAERAAVASRIQVTVVPEPETKKPGAVKGIKA